MICDLDAEENRSCSLKYLRKIRKNVIQDSWYTGRNLKQVPPNNKQKCGHVLWCSTIQKMAKLIAFYFINNHLRERGVWNCGQTCMNDTGVYTRTKHFLTSGITASVTNSCVAYCALYSLKRDVSCNTILRNMQWYCFVRKCKGGALL